MKINLSTEINKETFKSVYYEHKEYLVPAISITVSAILLLVFLIPQVTSLSAKYKEKNTEMTKLTELKQTTNLASTADLNKLDSDLSIASRALPASKDFETILNGLSTAATNSNVAIIGYQFQDVGFSVGSVQKFPALLFQIDVRAKPSEVIDFINKLYSSFPLSEVSSITDSKENASISVVFYYKPFAPVGSEEKTTIRKMNNLESQALDTISNWEILPPGIENILLPASPSAEIGSPF